MNATLETPDQRVVEDLEAAIERAAQCLSVSLLYWMVAGCGPLRSPGGRCAVSRMLAGVFTDQGDANGAPTRGRDHELTLLEALDELTPEQRTVMTGLIREFAGAVRKPPKGANHRTRDLHSFLSSPQVLYWFTVAQLHRLASTIAITAHVRAHEEEQQRGTTELLAEEDGE